MAAAGSSAFSSTLIANQPKGPFFIDTGGCGCALQEQLDKAAWRCLANATESMYQGQDGKWFYAANQENAASLKQPENSDSNPPDTGTAYEIQNNQWSSFPHDGGPVHAQDVSCTGHNATQASETFYKDMATLVSGQDDPCWQPGTLPLVIQNATEWNATGCNLGFFCEQRWLGVR